MAPKFQGHNIPKVVRQVGDKNTAILEDGTKVHRQEKIFLPTRGMEVPCVPYDNHFVFRDPRNVTGWLLVCSCGSPAFIIMASQYKQWVSPGGEMIACYVYTMAGHHADYSH